MPPLVTLLLAWLTFLSLPAAPLRDLPGHPLKPPTINLWPPLIGTYQHTLSILPQVMDPCAQRGLNVLMSSLCI